MKNRFKFSKIPLFLPFVLVFISSLYKPIDADLGWHLKYGEYFFQNFKILKDNIFSTEMPDYHWVNSSWATDLLTYSTFHFFGFLGLTILAGLIITTTFWFFSKAAKVTTWDITLIFPLLLIFLDPINAISFRGQLLSLLFLGILLYILNLYQENKSKIIFLITPLFIIWSNFHGGFLLGLALFFLWILLDILKDSLESFSLDSLIKNLKERTNLLLVFFFSIISVIINPFGIGVYTESFRHFGNPLQKYIIEWLPFSDLSQPWWNHFIFGTILLFGLLFLIFGGLWRSNLPQIGLTALIYTFSIAVRRYAWPLYYLAIPLLKPISSFFQPDNPKNTRIVSVILSLIFIVLSLFIKYPYDQYLNTSWNDFCQNLRCSDEAVKHLIENKYEGELLTLYNWGGWLIWNYPQIKPSIDGRMHLWQDEKTGYSAFSEYYKYEQNWLSIDDSKYDIALISKEKNIYEELVYLTLQNRWRLVYQDDRAAVFVRQLPNQQ